MYQPVGFAGDYELCIILKPASGLIFTTKAEGIPLNKDTVERWELWDKNVDIGGSLSGVEINGLVSGSLSVGDGNYCVAVYFKDGKKSLLEIHQGYYRALLEAMF